MSPEQKILLVDDDAANLQRITQALQEMDAEIVTAGNGAEALEVMARFTGPHGFPGIVVTDLKMPVMDGLELLARSLKIDGDLPVILISAYGEVARLS